MLLRCAHAALLRKCLLVEGLYYIIRLTVDE